MDSLRKITKKNSVIGIGAVSFFFALLMWYYAVIVSSEMIIASSKSKVYKKSDELVAIGISDIFPTIIISFSYLFLLPWDGMAGVRRINAPSRVGGACSPSCLKIFVGGGLFSIGMSWGLLFVVLHRFFLQLPSQPQPSSVVPGIFYLIHLMALGVTGACIFIFSSIQPGDRTPICGDEDNV